MLISARDDATIQPSTASGSLDDVQRACELKMVSALLMVWGIIFVGFAIVLYDRWSQRKERHSKHHR
jgi:hypothetical protein